MHCIYSQKKAIRCVNSEFVDKVKPEERAHLKISGNLFAGNTRGKKDEDYLKCFYQSIVRRKC